MERQTQQYKEEWQQMRLAWEKELVLNPNLSEDKKIEIIKLMDRYEEMVQNGHNPSDILKSQDFLLLKQQVKEEREKKGSNFLAQYEQQWKEMKEIQDKVIENQGQMIQNQHDMIQLAQGVGSIVCLTCAVAMYRLLRL
jgi:replication initiation and membrane attachment protein DnaB